MLSDSIIHGLLDGFYVAGVVWGFVVAIGAVLFATTIILFFLGLGKSLLESAKKWGSP